MTRLMTRLSQAAHVTPPGIRRKKKHRNIDTQAHQGRQDRVCGECASIDASSFGRPPHPPRQGHEVRPQRATREVALPLRCRNGCEWQGELAPTTVALIQGWPRRRARCVAELGASGLELGAWSLELAALGGADVVSRISLLALEAHWGTLRTPSQPSFRSCIAAFIKT